MRWKPKRTWKKQVENEGKKIGLSSMEDVLCRSMWIADVNLIAIGLE